VWAIQQTDLRIGLEFDEPEVKAKLAKALAHVTLGDASRLRHQVSSLAAHLADENPYVQERVAEALGLLTGTDMGVESGPILGLPSTSSTTTHRRSCPSECSSVDDDWLTRGPGRPRIVSPRWSRFEMEPTTSSKRWMRLTTAGVPTAGSASPKAGRRCVRVAVRLTDI